MPDIAMEKRVPLRYPEAVSRMKDALQKEGFGVLTEIDVKATMREKLGIEFRDYVILGACNPQLAHRALEEDLRLGTLLPCNVVVYADGDDSVISVFDPTVGMRVLASESLTIEEVGLEARQRLARALANV